MMLIQLNSVNSVEMKMADERTATFLQIVTPKLQAYCKLQPSTGTLSTILSFLISAQKTNIFQMFQHTQSHKLFHALKCYL